MRGTREASPVEGGLVSGLTDAILTPRETGFGLEFDWDWVMGERRSHAEFCHGPYPVQLGKKMYTL